MASARALSPGPSAMVAALLLLALAAPAVAVLQRDMAYIMVAKAYSGAYARRGQSADIVAPSCIGLRQPHG